MDDTTLYFDVQRITKLIVIVTRKHTCVSSTHNNWYPAAHSRCQQRWRLACWYSGVEHLCARGVALLWILCFQSTRRHVQDNVSSNGHLISNSGCNFVCASAQVNALTYSTSIVNCDNQRQSGAIYLWTTGPACMACSSTIGHVRDRLHTGDFGPIWTAYRVQYIKTVWLSIC